MKLVHIEVHDEDEGEEWDERDKANYERNKQVQEASKFKKISME